MRGATAIARLRAWARRQWHSRKTREQKGIRLLKDWLTAEQLRDYENTKSFEVIGCHSGKRFRILYGRVTNVIELDRAGRIVTGWCFVPSGSLVAGDVMLAQKIALETDEEAALSVANRFAVRMPGIASVGWTGHQFR